MRKPRWLDSAEVQRWLTARCDHCGHRFRWKRDARHSFGNRDGKVWHGPCIALVQWRSKAEERLDVVALACGVAGLSGRDLQGIAEMRGTTVPGADNERDKVWRVFYDLEKRHAETTSP